MTVVTQLVEPVLQRVINSAQQVDQFGEFPFVDRFLHQPDFLQEANDVIPHAAEVGR